MKKRQLSTTISILLAVFVPILLWGGEQNFDKFIGTWNGEWKPGFLDTTLVVKTVEGNKAQVVYKWGTSPFWRINQPDERELEGKFLDGKTLKLEFTDNIGRVTREAVYVLQPDGTLAAKFISRNGIASATMKKVKK